MSAPGKAMLRDVVHILPDDDLSNERLLEQHPDWPVAKIARLTGVQHRRIARPDEFTSDLCVRAAQKLFAKGQVAAQDIDFIILCTMTPDYQLPATACLVQSRLGIPTTAGAFDLSMGCSGYVYGLGVAKGLIETGQARNILFLTGEVITRLLNPADQAAVTIFGDAATATWISSAPSETEAIGPFDYGTNGSTETMVAVGGGLRGLARRLAGTPWGEPDMVRMNGPEVFNFTLDVVPGNVARTLGKAGLRLEDIDLFVFHQANKYIMDYLRQKMNVPADRFSVQISFCGNTIACSIPIALAVEKESGRLREGMRLLLVGFGVGYSWGAAVARWGG